MVKVKSVLDYLAYAIALLGFVPLFSYLEPLPRLVFPLALAGGIAIEWKRWRISSGVATAISLALFTYYAVQFSRTNVVAPAVNLIVIFLSIRLLSERSPRHYLQIYALALFCLAGLSLFSLSPSFLGYFLLMLMLIAVSLVMLTYYTSTSKQVLSFSRLKSILSTALLMPLASFPLMLFFFFILPRTQFPLWHYLYGGGPKVTGFTEKIDPGAAPAVEEVKDVAFRVHAPRLPSDQLYWRGIVLNQFEGNAWVRQEPPQGEQETAGKGRVVHQTVFPEPGRGRFLLALNIPDSISGIRSTTSPDCIHIKLGGPAAAREKYDAVSSIGSVVLAVKGVDREFYLRTPRRLSPRIVALGRSISERGRDEADKIELLGKFFADGKYVYANIGLPVGPDPLDQFVFEKRKGHCEFFASSFAVLLRLAGVPSRLVGGYYGGNYNDFGEYYVVTEDMAHVWVEAFVQGKGWVTIDPSKWGINFSGKEAAKGKMFRRISLILDGLTYYWNVAVINYDLDRQLRLLAAANLQMKQLSFTPNFKPQMFLCLVPVGVLLLHLLVRRRRGVSVEERILRKFLRKIHLQYGVDLPAGSGLEEFVAGLGDPNAKAFVELYASAIYRDRGLTFKEAKRLTQYTKKLGKRG